MMSYGGVTINIDMKTHNNPTITKRINNTIIQSANISNLKIEKHLNFLRKLKWIMVCVEAYDKLLFHKDDFELLRESEHEK